MVITAVDESLEKLLRAAVPLPPELADVSFETPDGSWGAQLSRITVSLFLFDVSRSPLPPQPPASRSREDGRLELRPPLPLVKLSYLVSAWAGNTSDEHQVLGEVLGCFLGYDAIPAVHLPAGLPASVQLSIGGREGRKPGELWSALQGKLKPSFELEATVALDAGWRLAPPAVTRIEGEVSRTPDQPVAARSSRSAYSSSAADQPDIIRRRSGAAVVAEVRPPAQP